MAGFTGALGSLWVEIGARISNFEAGMASVSKQIDQTLGEAEGKFAGFDKLGDRLTGIGTSLSAAITLPVLGIGAAALKASGDFDSAMRLVSARGDITGGDLAKLKKQAEDLGAATQFSSKQAAEGMAELAGAGFDVNEIYAAMPGVLNLAAAAGTSVGEAAKVSKDLLGQFGLSANDTARAVDVMTKAGNESSGTLGEMANSLKYVGPVARAAGLDLEQTSAALIVLDKAGIRGEQAGTSLRSMLLSLQNPSKAARTVLNDLGIAITDAGNNLLPLPQIMDNFKAGLEKVHGSAGQAAALTTVFGENAVTAAQGLISKGSPALIDFEEKLRNAGGEAQRTASVMNSGMGGALERMRGSVETAAQKLGDVLAPTIIQLAGYIEQGANKLAEFAGWFQKLPEPIQTGTIAIIAMSAALGPLLIVAGQFAGAITSINAVLPLMSGGVTAITGALGIGTAALAAYTVGIAAAVAAIGTIIVKYNQWQDAQAAADKAADDQATALIRLERHLRDQGGAVDALKDEYKRGQISLQEYEKGLQKIAIQIGDAKKATADHTKTLSDAEKVQKAVKDATTAAAKATNSLGKESKDAEGKVKPLVERSAILDETARQLTATYQKNISEIVKWKLAHQDAASTTPVLTQTTKDLDAAIQAMVSSAKLIAPAFLDAGKQATQAMNDAVQPIKDVEAAYKQLGITSTEKLQKQADDAKTAYDTIKGSGTATAHDIDAAWVKMEDARIAAAKAAGIEIPAETQATLDKIKGSLEGHTNDTKGTWAGWSKGVSQVISDLGSDITNILWDGDKSWGEKGKAILKSLGESVQKAFVQPAMDAINDLITGAISDLLGGKGLGGIMDRLKDIGGAFKDIFSAGTSAASGATGAAGSAGSSGGAGGAAAGGALGWVSAIGSIGTMISSIIGNFQSAHMETSLNAIEHNTRYSMMYVGERADGGILGQTFRMADALQYVPGLLDGLNAKMDNWVSPLAGILQGMAGKLDAAAHRLDDISNNTSLSYWSSENNRGVLNSMLTELRTISGRQPIINVYVGDSKTPAPSNVKMQGVLGL
jgi:TP901 family phage tail tape measure protein